MKLLRNLYRKKIEKNINKYGLDKNISYLMDYVYHNQLELAKYYISLIENKYIIKKNSFDEYYIIKSKALILIKEDGINNLRESLIMLENLKEHPIIKNDKLRQEDIDKYINNIKYKMNIFK